MAGPYLIATGQPPCARRTSYISPCSVVGEAHYLDPQVSRLTHSRIYLRHALSSKARHTINHTSKSELRPSILRLRLQLSPLLLSPSIISHTTWLLPTSRNQRSLRPRLPFPTTSPRRTLCLATKVSNGAMAEHPTTPRPARFGRKVSRITHDVSHSCKKDRSRHMLLCATYHASNPPCGQVSHDQQGSAVQQQLM